MSHVESTSRTLPHRVWVPPEDRVCRTAGAGRLDCISGLNVLTLRGTSYEMGLQHGQLLREEINDGIFDFYVNYLTRLLETASRRKSRGILDTIQKFMQRNLFAGRMFARLVRRAPKSVLEEIHGIADGCGLPMERLLRAFVVADMLLFVVGRVFVTRRRIAPALLSACYPLASACTSLVAWGPGTVDGRLLHGRNLEFLGSGFWERHPTVIHFHPVSGMRYSSVTTAGVGTSGVTCTNEAGLTFSVHINTTRDVSLDGVPMIWLLDHVARHATSIPDAARLAGEYQAAAGFTFVITDAKVNQAATLEVSATQQCLRYGEQGRLVQANHYLTAEQQEGELEVHTSIRAQTLARYHRSRELLEQETGKVDVPTMMRFLSDSHDPYLRCDRPLGNTVCQPHNISSVVFEPAERRMWVAVGPAPACRNPFYAVDCGNEGGWDGWIRFHAGRPALPTGERESFECYMSAYRKATTGASAAHVLEDLEAACRQAPGEPAFHYACGIYQLKLRRFGPALEYLDRVGWVSELAHKAPSIRVWRGVALLGLNRVPEAHAEFAAARDAEGAGAETRGLAERALAGQLEFDNLSLIDFDFVFTDVIDFS